MILEGADQRRCAAKQRPCPNNAGRCFRNVCSHRIRRFHFLVLGDRPGFSVILGPGMVLSSMLFAALCVMRAPSELHECLGVNDVPPSFHCCSLLRARLDNSPNTARCCFHHFFGILPLCGQGGGGGGPRPTCSSVPVPPFVCPCSDPPHTQGYSLGTTAAANSLGPPPPPPLPKYSLPAPHSDGALHNLLWSTVSTAAVIAGSRANTPPAARSRTTPAGA